MLPLLAGKALEACILLVARLTFIPGAEFVQQCVVLLPAVVFCDTLCRYVSSNGLHKACVSSILGSDGSAVQQGGGQPGDGVIVEALHLLSNIARASAAHYPALQVRGDE